MKFSPLALLLLCFIGNFHSLFGQEISPIIPDSLEIGLIPPQDSLQQQQFEELRNLQEKVRDQIAEMNHISSTGSPYVYNMPIHVPRVDNLAPIVVAPIDPTVRYNMPIAGLQAPKSRGKNRRKK